MHWTADLSRFGLEPLESRLLLSADLIATASVDDAPDSLDATAQSAVIVECAPAAEKVSEIAEHASVGTNSVDSGNYIFAGLGEGNEISNGTGEAGIPSTTVLASQVATPDVDTGSSLIAVDSTDSASTPVLPAAVGGTLAEQSASLYTANGPPVGAAFLQQAEGQTNAFPGNPESSQAGKVVEFGNNQLFMPPPFQLTVLAIAAGYHHSLALMSDGTVEGWGSNEFGQATPPAYLQDVIAIAAGEYHSLALKSDGTVVAWGSTAPPPAGLKDVVAIAAGGVHSTALKRDGTVVNWLTNGDGEAINISGLSDAVAIAAARYSSMALKQDGTVVGWEPDWTTTFPLRLSEVVAIADGNGGWGLKRDGTLTVYGTTIQPPAGLSNIVAITAGPNHCLALKTDGTVVGWGNDTAGQVTPPAGLIDVVAITAGEDHSLALKKDGTIVGWGSNASGQLTRIQPTYNAIAAGAHHSLALKTDGTVIGWGENFYGQATPTWLFDVVAIAAGEAHSLALKSDGTVVAWGLTYAMPPEVSDVKAIAAGSYFSLALRKDGTVIGWGDNYYGQTTPPTDLKDVKAIAAGGSHSLALKNDGTVVGWGLNDAGQATPPVGLSGVIAVAAGRSFSLALKGDGTVVGWGVNWILPPTWLTDVIAIAAGDEHALALTKMGGVVYGWGIDNSGEAAYFWGLSGAVAIAAGSGYSLALKSDGTIVGWGSNYQGEATPPAGLSDVVATAAGSLHSLALRRDGTVVGWGSNWFGQATPPAGLRDVIAIAAGESHSLALKGDGTVMEWGVASYSPPNNLSGVTAIASGPNHCLALKSDGTIVGWGWNNYGEATPPTGLSGVIAIAAGNSYSLALKSDGTVVGWGNNYQNQAIPPEGLKDVIAIDAGYYHSLALKNNGTIVGWGSNYDGEATPPVGLNGVVAIAAGHGCSLAVKNDGMVVGWGGNRAGQVTPPAGLGDVVSITAGDYHDLAVKKDGTVVGWGSNSNRWIKMPTGLSGVFGVVAGRFQTLALMRDGTVVSWGDNREGQALPPAGLGDVVAIAAGDYHSLALKSNGTVVGWGSNGSGQSAPPPGLSDVVAIAAGGSHSLALKNNGTVVGWGDNHYGQATPPAGLGNVVAIDAGNRHSMALKMDGTVVVWGDNSYGQDAIPPGLNGVVAIAAGGLHCVALKSDGTVVAWGWNGNEAATPPSGLSNVAGISAGWLSNLALKKDGTVVGWGWGGWGQTTPPSNLSGVVAVAIGEVTSCAAIKRITGNDVPTLYAISNVTILEDADRLTMDLAGISAGLGEGDQPLTITAASSNANIIPIPTVSYSYPNTTGKLTLMPIADASGMSQITVTVQDWGLDGIYGNDDDGIFSRTFTVIVRPVNDPPTLDAISNLTILEGASAQTVNLTGISAGGNESGQRPIVSATSSDISIIPNPMVSYTSPNQTATLTFTPGADSNGKVTITVTVQDDGGTENGGLNTFSQAFTITVTPVNDSPTLGWIDPVTILEDSDWKAIDLKWISPDPGEAGQQVTVTATASDPALISGLWVDYVNPNGTGTLWLKPAANKFGAADITVTVKDDGGTANGGVDTFSRMFTVTVTPVNDAPTLDKFSFSDWILEDAAEQTVGLTRITPGPGEAGQKLTVMATSSDINVIPHPTIAYTNPNETGTLTFKPIKDANGKVTITVMVQDDGGTENGGVNTVTQQFTVEVKAVNDAPTMTPINPLTVSLDAGIQTVALSGISAGPTDEVPQVVSVSAVSGDLQLVSAPSVTYDSVNGTGTLRFQPLAPGKTTITVTVWDDGGTANGGVDKLALSFDVTVTAAALVITWNPPADIVYGTPLGANQLNATANQPGHVVYNPPAGTILKAGLAQTMTATFTADDQISYPGSTNVNVTINVQKASLTVRADNQRVPLGNPLPALTWSYAGLVSGDTAASIGLSVTASTTATSTSPVNNYPISVTGPLESANYTIVYVAGNLEIFQGLPVAVSFDLTDCVRLNVGTVTPIDQPQPGGPVATGSNVELVFGLSPATPKFTFNTIDLYRDDGSSSLNGFVLTIPEQPTSDPIGVGADSGGIFLEYANATMQAGALSLRHGVASGELVLNADTAKLFPKASGFSGTITNGGRGGPGLIAKYVASENRWLYTVEELTLMVNNVIRAGASNVVLTYSPCGSPGQALATVPNLTVTLLPLGSQTITVEQLTIREDGFALAKASTVLKDVTLGGFVSLTAPTVALSGLNYTEGSHATGILSISTTAASLFPGQPGPSVVLSDGPDPDPNVITGSFDFGAQVFTLAVDKADITAQNALFLTVQGATLRYDLNGAVTQAILQADTVSVSVPTLGIDGTARDLQITQGGEFSVASLTLNSQGLLQTLGLGGLLPFEISSAEIKFAGDANKNGRRDAGEVFRLDAFDLSVNGYFDFAGLDDLSFRPIIRIGPPGSQSVFDNAQDQFSFTVTVANGKVRPKDLGPIELGVADLSVGQTVMMSGAIELGGYQNGQWVNAYGGHLKLASSSAMEDIAGGESIEIDVSFDGEQGNLDVTASFPLSFRLGHCIVVNNAHLKFELGLGAGGDASVRLRYMRLVSTSVERLEIDLGSFLKLTATDAMLSFRPDAGQNIAQFGSLSARLEFLGFTGTAWNFAIGADGALKALPGFGVGFDLESGQSSALKWPDWLPLKIPRLKIVWPDFNRLDDYRTVLEKTEVTGLKGLPVTVTGEVEDAVIDLDLLKQGKFPVVSLGSAILHISGQMFGGEIGGTLGLGLLRLDAAGQPVAAGDETTPVAERILYGGITAEFAFSGLSGFKIRIGLSERGPLSLYVMADIPILLEPISGLTIRKLRAGVTFDTVLPSVTDPLALRGAAFRPQSQMTDEQWWEQLQVAVINQSRAPPGAGFWSAFNRPMKIEGGALLYSAYISDTVFNADCDLVISTDGKFLLNALCTYGNTLKERSIFYADLSKLRDGSGALLYLSDTPAKNPIITKWGALIFEFKRQDGTRVTETNQADAFQIRIDGGIALQAYDLAIITLKGQVILTIGSSQFDLEFTGRLMLTALGQEVTLVGAAGKLHVNTADSSIKVWGALAITPQLEFLERVGITASGMTVFTLNLTAQEHEEALTIPGQQNPTTVRVKPNAVGFRLEGALQFKQAGSDWFLMEGTFELELSGQDTLSVMAVGQLALRVEGKTLLRFDYDGLLQISPRGVAALLDLNLAASLPADYGVRFGGHLTLYLNTTCQPLTYVLPNGVTNIPGGGSNRTLSVPGGPPGLGSQPYLQVIAPEGWVEVQSWRVNGSFYLLVTPAAIQLAVAGTLDVRVAGAAFFSFDVIGGFQLEGQGIAAVIALSLRAGLPSNLGVDVSASYRLEVNTINQQRNVDGVVLEAGRYARVRANGTLWISGLRLDGSFEIIPGLNLLNIGTTATLKLQAGGVSLLSFDVVGEFQLDAEGLAGALAISLRSRLSLGYEFNATYQLEVNTTNQERKLGSVVLEAGRYGRILAKGNLAIGSFLIEGSFVLTVGASQVQVEAQGRLDLKINGATLLGFDVAGSLRIDREGMAAAIGLGLRLGLPSAMGFSLSGYRLEINTTNREVTLNGVVLPVYTVRIAAQGSLQIPGAFRFDGRFWLRAHSDRILIQANVSVDLYLTKVGFAADLALFGDGLAFGVTFQTREVHSNFFTLAGTFDLQINTSDREVFSIPAKTAMVYVSGGRLTLAGLSLSGAIRIGYSDSLLVINVPEADPLTVSIFNTFTVQMHGFIRSDGQFSLTGTGAATLGRTSLVGLNGTVTVTMSNSGVRAALSGRLYILGQTGPNLGANLAITTTGFSTSISVSVNFTVMNILRVSGNGSLKISNSGLILTANVRTRIFNSLNLNVSVEINTLTSRYRVSGSTGFSIGGSNLGARGTLSVSLTNYEGVSITASGSAWAGFSIFGRRVGASAGFDTSLGVDGQFDVGVGACIKIWRKKICGGATVHVSLRNGLRVWLSDVTNAYVFLDVNNNGVVDANEPFTVSDADGNFSFTDETDQEVGSVPLYEPLGLLAPFDLNANDRLDPEEGHLYVVGGTRLDPETGDPIPGDGPIVSDSIVGPLLTGLCPAEGAELIFFDANKNGLQDAGEVGVAPGADGFYTFIDLSAITINNLGRLRPFDTNGNGIIDPAEGHFVIYGGMDKNTGLPNTQVIKLPAYGYGCGLYSTANPLSDLLFALEQSGMTHQAANTAIQAAFGLPTQIDVSQFDPRSLDAVEPLDLNLTLRAATQVSTLLQTGAVAFRDPAAGRAALIQQMVESIRPLKLPDPWPTDPNGEPLYVAQLNLSDVPTVQSLLANAAAATQEPLSAAQLQAIARVIVQMNLQVSSVTTPAGALVGSASLLAENQTETGDLITATAGPKKVSQVEAAAAVAQIASGSSDPVLLANKFIANLPGYLHDTKLPPFISPIEDQSSAGGSLPLSFVVQNPNAVPGTLSVTASADNPELLPDGAVALITNPADWTLNLQPARGRSGEATITVQATVAFGNGTKLVSTEQFRLKVLAVNYAPTVTVISDQTIAENGHTEALTFTIGDTETAANDLVVTAVSNDPALVAGDGLVLGGTGSNRTLTVTPARDHSGVTAITVLVSDGVVQSPMTFLLTVLPRNDPPTLALVPDPAFVDPNHSDGLGLLVAEDSHLEVMALNVGDRESAPDTLMIEFSSDNAELFTAASFVLTGASGERRLTLVPVAGHSGEARITASVSDGIYSTTQHFDVQVIPVNTPPIIIPVIPQRTREGTPLTVVLTASDDHVAAVDLLWNAVSSDSALLPAAGFAWGSSNGQRTLTLRPVAGHFGTVTITITVSDGDLITTETFPLTIDPVNSAPTITKLADQYILENQSTGFLAFTVADRERDATVLMVTAHSSNPALVPAAGMRMGGWGTDRTLLVAPAAGQSGTAVITLTVSDGEVSTSTDFNLEVLPGALRIVAWSSVGPHQGIGAVGLAIPDDTSFSEPRLGGINQLWITFSSAITPVSFTPDTVRLEGLAAPDNQPVDLGGISWTTSLRQGNLVGVIQFNQPLPNAARYRVTLSGVGTPEGETLSGDADRILTALMGDVNGDLRVDNTDAGGVQSLRGINGIDPAVSWQVRSDLNQDGRINNADLGGLYPLRGHDARFIATPAANAIAMSQAGTYAIAIQLVRRLCGEDTSAKLAWLSSGSKASAPPASGLYGSDTLSLFDGRMDRLPAGPRLGADWTVCTPRYLHAPDTIEEFHRSAGFRSDNLIYATF